MAFLYSHGRLCVGSTAASLDVESLARSVGGPTYIYDFDDVQLRLEALQRSLAGLPSSIHYAMKANSHHRLLELFRRHDVGVDTVSGGEIRRALNAGIPAARIVFSGVGKTVGEIEFAIARGIKQINVESPAELERIGNIAKRMGRVADVAFRLNPDVNPVTHPYITTGLKENKFGMDISFAPELLRLLQRHAGHVQFRGLTVHIGSLLFDLEVIGEALDRLLVAGGIFTAAGYKMDRIDLGGGLGIHYETADPSRELHMIEQYGAMIRNRLRDFAGEILFEPGRILVARAGILVGEVQYIKQNHDRRFAILDTGMHHLLRPALYGARHRLLKVVEDDSKAVASGEEARTTDLLAYDVVGPICESTDVLCRDVRLPTLQQGDLVAIADTGAYGFVMASHYNSHDLPHEICISKGQVLP